MFGLFFDHLWLLPLRLSFRSLLGLAGKVGDWLVKRLRHEWSWLFELRDWRGYVYFRLGQSSLILLLLNSNLLVLTIDKFEFVFYFSSVVRQTQVRTLQFLDIAGWWLLLTCFLQLLKFLLREILLFNLLFGCFLLTLLIVLLRNYLLLLLLLSHSRCCGYLLSGSKLLMLLIMMFLLSLWI